MRKQEKAEGERSRMKSRTTTRRIERKMGKHTQGRWGTTKRTMRRQQ